MLSELASELDLDEERFLVFAQAVADEAALRKGTR